MTRSDERSSTESATDLDFERADFDGASKHSNPGSMSCSICDNAISETYFTKDAAFVCARCEGPSRAAGAPGSGFSRLSGAAATGVVAAAIASALWMVVTELSGYEIGLIAIAVGWIVGVAIQIGNRGVGGRPYQLLAVFLTYSAIVMTYVPMLVSEFESQWTEPATERQQDEDLGPGSVVDDIDADTANQTDELQLTPEGATLAAWVVAIPLAYAVPFLAGFENAIGILIIGFALYQAWRMTAKTQILWSGPFQVGSDSGE